MIPNVGKRAARAWPHVRAILILLHIVMVLTLCSPPRYKVLAEEKWNAPAADATFAAWADRLSSIGIKTSPKRVKSFWKNRIENYADGHDFLSRPARRYADFFHLGQGWSLFSTPKRKPAILVVDIRSRGGPWRPLYRQRSNEHTWRRRMFDNNRIRKLVGRFSRGGKATGTGLYVPLGNWLARLAAAEFPSDDEIRTRLWRYETAAPGADFDPGEGRFTNQRILSLGRHR